METITRNPNTQCIVCDKPIYRRPNQLAKSNRFFCSKSCESSLSLLGKEVECANESCSNMFVPDRATRKYCSHSCSNEARRGITYGKVGFNNSSARRLFEFTQVCNQKSCAIEGCDYDKTYDMHRVVPGRLGGKYEIGNMFALCPNHHAEIERGMLQVEVVNKCTLRVV